MQCGNISLSLSSSLSAGCVHGIHFIQISRDIFSILSGDNSETFPHSLDDRSQGGRRKKGRREDYTPLKRIFYYIIIGVISKERERERRGGGKAVWNFKHDLFFPLSLFFINQTTAASLSFFSLRILFLLSSPQHKRMSHLSCMRKREKGGGRRRKEIIFRSFQANPRFVCGEFCFPSCSFFSLFLLPSRFIDELNRIFSGPREKREKREA